MRRTRREPSTQSSSYLPITSLRPARTGNDRAGLTVLLAPLVALPSVLISDEPIDPTERQGCYREREQLRRISGRDIENDQLADDGQQRDQDHGADLYDALRSLGHEQKGSLELERDNHREDHSKHALECREIGQVEGVRQDQAEQDLDCQLPDGRDDYN